MELKLLTPLNNLPKVIEFNYDEILLEAERSVDKYKGLIYDDKQLVDAKSDRAEINSKIKALKSLKSDVKKELTRPYEEFSAKMDNIIAVFENAVLGIDNHVKAVENKAKEEKRQQIIQAFNEILETYSDYVSINTIWNDRWLNVTYKLPVIIKELKDLKEKIITDTRAISELNSEDETELLAYYFNCLDFGKTLIKHNNVKAEKEKVAKLITPKTSAKENKEVKQEPVAEEKSYVLDLKITGTKTQLGLLKSFLLNNNIKFEKLN